MGKARPCEVRSHLAWSTETSEGLRVLGSACGLVVVGFYELRVGSLLGFRAGRLSCAYLSDTFRAQDLGKLACKLSDFCVRVYRWLLPGPVPGRSLYLRMHSSQPL